MFKKILLLICVLMLVIFVSCGKKDDISYVNEKYGFTFSPPDNWKDNYSVFVSEKSDYYMRIEFKSKTVNKEEIEIASPIFISIHAITNDKYEKNKDNDMYDGGPYIKHPSKDIGLWVVYSDPYIKEEDRELYWDMFEAVEPENIEKYLYFNDTK